MAKAVAETVQELLEKRNAESAKKETLYGTYHRVISEGYMEESPGEVFEEYMTPLVEKHYKLLSPEDRQGYMRLNRHHNAAIDLEIRKIDEKIKAMKLEKGCQEELPDPQLPEQSCLQDKFFFNPINWYLIYSVYSDRNSCIFDWRNDLVALTENAVESWLTLSDTEKQKYTTLAQQEYTLYVKESNTTDSTASSSETAVDVVDGILARCLLKHAKVKKTRQQNATLP